MTRGWEDSWLRVRRLVEMAGRLGLSAGLSLTTTTLIGQKPTDRAGSSRFSRELRGHCRKGDMDAMTARSGQAFPTLKRLQTMLTSDFSLERCLAWREGDVCKVLLSGRRIETVEVGPSGRILRPDVSGSARDRIVTSSRISRKISGLPVHLCFTMALASALAELAQATGLGLRICRWSTILRPREPWD